MGLRVWSTFEDERPFVTTSSTLAVVLRTGGWSKGSVLCRGGSLSGGGESCQGPLTCLGELKDYV